MTPDAASDPLLQGQQERLEALAALLQTELDLLLAGDPGALPELAQRKSALCAEVEALERQRAQRAPRADDARGRRLRELTQAVAQANQRNGVVIAALIRNTQGALDILRGVTPGESGAIYGRGGQALGGQQASKPLGSA
jgi:flagella synthesis protein FlgN